MDSWFHTPPTLLCFDAKHGQTRAAFQIKRVALHHLFLCSPSKPTPPSQTPAVCVYFYGLATLTSATEGQIGPTRQTTVRVSIFPPLSNKFGVIRALLFSLTGSGGPRAPQKRGS